MSWLGFGLVIGVVVVNVFVFRIFIMEWGYFKECGDDFGEKAVVRRVLYFVDD